MFKNLKWSEIKNYVPGILCLVLGICFCCFAPGAAKDIVNFIGGTFQFVLLTIGIIIIIVSIVFLCLGLFPIDLTAGYWFIVGIFIMLSGILLKAIFPTLIIIYIIVRGCLNIYHALTLRNLKNKYWLIEFIIGIIYAVMGIIAISLNNTDFFGLTIGIILIIHGLISLINDIFFEKRIINYQKTSPNDFIICPHCRHKVRKGVHKCPHCGLNFNDIIDAEIK